MITTINTVNLISTSKDRKFVTQNNYFLVKFVKLTQYLTWPLFYLIFNTIFKLKIKGSENFEGIKGPFIIISNHISFYDSFLYRLVLGFSTPHLPLRFMAVKKFEWKFLNFFAAIGLIDLIYLLFGVFTITEGEGIEKGLQEASRIIVNGGNVVIYPEGRINKSSDLVTFKKGAAVLALKTSVPVIPVSFRFDKKILFKNFRINIGNPICLNSSLSPDEATNIFYQNIKELHNTF